MARDVVEHFRPTGKILEPCRGDGSFFDAFPHNAEKLWCEIQDGQDFFDFHGQVDWIISNPPWSEFRAFNIHAMNLATNIVWIIPLVHLCGKARIRDVEAKGYGPREFLLLDTPATWPQGGFQIAAVHIQRQYAGPVAFSRCVNGADQGAAGGTGGPRHPLPVTPTC
jgi:hypothetical protein